MSQAQQQRPQQQQGGGPNPIKYGDVFDASGYLASQPVAPADAAMMQSLETAVFGETQKGGVAATMQAAAVFDERVGVVGHMDVSDPAADQGVTVTQVDVPGEWIFTESVGGQVVGQYVQSVPPQVQAFFRCGVKGGNQGGGDDDEGADALTIADALEATARLAGDKPMDQSDAAAIQVAEVRATGVVVSGGVGSMAQSAAALNVQIERDEDKIKIADILTNATVRLPADKEATRQDAEGVVAAELRNNPDLMIDPRGVAASVAAAARLNERTQ
ncbi:hypothetical protein Drorol1_Dr00007729 [Drosera rotundifolia]